MTLDELKQSFSKDFLGDSNEAEFTKFLNNLVLQGKLAQITANHYHGGEPKKFFNDYFDIDIFCVQENGIDFLKLCLNEMKDQIFLTQIFISLMAHRVRL